MSVNPMRSKIFLRCKTKPQIYFNAEELDKGTMPLLLLVGQTPRYQAAR